MPVVSDLTSGTSEGAEISDGGHSTTAHPPIHAKSGHGPCPSSGAILHREGVWRLGAVTGGEGQRGLTWRLHPSRVKVTAVDACKGSTREVTQASASRGHIVRACTGPTCSSTPPPRGKGHNEGAGADGLRPSSGTPDSHRAKGKSCPAPL